MPVSTFFTAGTAPDILAIDLFVDTDSGTVTNTRANAVVRHNETNRFFVIPSVSVITSPQSLYLGNFAQDYGANNYSYAKYFIPSMRLAARPLSGAGEYAFDITASVVTTWYTIGESSLENTIGAGPYQSLNVGSYAAFVGCFVVTAVSPEILDLSRKNLSLGGDGSVPLVGQISYVVSPGFGWYYTGGFGSVVAPRFYQTVTTVLSRPFSLTYQAPLHRDASY